MDFLETGGTGAPVQPGDYAGLCAYLLKVMGLGSFSDGASFVQALSDAKRETERIIEVPLAWEGWQIILFKREFCKALAFHRRFEGEHALREISKEEAASIKRYVKTYTMPPVERLDEGMSREWFDPEFYRFAHRVVSKPGTEEFVLKHLAHLLRAQEHGFKEIGESLVKITKKLVLDGIPPDYNA